MTTIIDKFINTYDTTTLNIYGTYTDPLFKALEIGEMIQHKKIRNLIQTIPQDFKKIMPIQTNKGQRNATFLTEAGLYYVVMRSDKQEAKQFQVWVCTDVLPQIRKKGIYTIENKQVRNDIRFKIFSEYDLQKKVINFIKNQYSDVLFNVSLGEMQDDTQKRIQGYELGYEKGEPDMIINNLHKKYSGFAIEFKTPRGTGAFNKYQSNRLKKYRQNNFLTLVSNDYDNILFQIINYMNETRIKCEFCRGKFKNNKTLANHHKYIHKITI